MEKFILLFRGGINHAYNANESNEAMENMKEWMNWMGGLQQKGIMVAADPFLPTGKQVIGFGKKVADGAYVQNEEQVGGYLIVNANDIDDAVEISKGCPVLKENGKVEIRPIQKMEM
ncbi:MAG TPA: YciI family protein [Chitinophagaceae bacterium]|jgi:hypothetical protein